MKRRERRIEWHTWGRIKVIEGYSAKEVIEIIEAARPAPAVKKDDEGIQPVG